MHIVIMAGGGGTRLWPLSRRDNPKQFLDLGSGQTLLEHTYARAQQLAPPDHIFVATAESYASRVQAILPQLAADHLFLEPAKRDTAAAFAAAAIQLVQRGAGEEPTIFMWSDHVFTAEDTFVADLKKVPRLLKDHPRTIVIFGHIPTFPETGFGYIEIGEPLKGEANIATVKAFKEKPDAATAEQYLLAKRYYWNMAYISTRPRYLLDELKQYEPALMAGITAFAAALGAGNQAQAVKEYEALPKIAIDYALLERTPRIVAITGDYGWSDVGNWAAVHDLFGQKGDIVPQGYHVHLNSQNNFIFNDTSKVVSMIGMRDTIVVVTKDAILITNRHDAHQVKDVVARLEKERRTKHL